MLARTLIASVLVGFLIGCEQANQEPTKSSTATSSNSNNTEIGSLDIIASETKSPTLSTTPIESQITVAEAAQLSSSQVEELLRLTGQAKQLMEKNGDWTPDGYSKNFRIIAPTYIPKGFQVEVGGGGYEGYSISYRNPSSGACFQIQGNFGGWGAGESDYQEIKVFSQALGLVTLEFVSFDRESNGSRINFLDAPIVRNGGGYFFSSSYNEYENCSSISPQEAVKIVESLQYLDSPQTKARPLEEIEEDAAILVNKFEFPLNSCGDPPSSSADQWYPVFLDGGRASNGGQQYCKDALVKEEKNGFAKIQLGSFTSYEKASEFAKAVGGRVGKPDN